VTLHFQKNPYQGRIFGVSAVSGIMAAGLAANSEILQFRVVDATELRKFRVLSVLFSAATDTTAFTAGAATFDMVPARAWTAAGTGGGTATLTGNNGKFRTAQNTNIMGVSGEIRIATTAALGAGTKTLDSQGVAALCGGASAAGLQIVVPTDFLQEAFQTDGEPLIVSHQEGFVIRASVPATGTWKWAASILWAELSQ
jgi:hypothetical protein